MVARDDGLYWIDSDLHRTHFLLVETSCPCGCERNEMKQVFIDRLEHFRRLLGDKPIIVTSAFRCPVYNATIPGTAQNSDHTRGLAADVVVHNDERPITELARIAVAVGFDGVGDYADGHLHVDLGGKRHADGGPRQWTG